MLGLLSSVRPRESGDPALSASKTRVNALMALDSRFRGNERSGNGAPDFELAADASSRLLPTLPLLTQCGHPCCERSIGLPSGSVHNLAAVML
jgi:hypothetical protein